jgi:hypothetical protein
LKSAKPPTQSNEELIERRIAKLKSKEFSKEQTLLKRQQQEENKQRKLQQQLPRKNEAQAMTTMNNIIVCHSVTQLKYARPEKSILRGILKSPEGTRKKQENVNFPDNQLHTTVRYYPSQIVTSIFHKLYDTEGPISKSKWKKIKGIKPSDEYIPIAYTHAGYTPKNG